MAQNNRLMHFQTKNSILCPNCKKLTSRREVRCPYCGIRNPGSLLKNNKLTKLLAKPEQLVQAILYANVGMFILSILINPGRPNMNFSPFSFLSPSNQSLLVLGSTGTVPILQMERWWTLVSANYLHGGLLHIVFNMIALRQLAPGVAKIFGTHRMFIIYTVGGVFGFLLSFLAGIHFTIGASAAVCSLIGAVLFYGKTSGATDLYRQVSGWAISIFVFGFMVPGINNWGHGGGMAAGAALAYLMGYYGYPGRSEETPGHRLIALFCGVVTALVLAWSCFNGFAFILLR